MGNKKKCNNCKDIPPLEEKLNKMKLYRKKLTQLGSGRYYRGQDLQLSTFTLWQCADCKTYFEDSHHYYSDPESTMGLGRDESDWYNFRRLKADKAKILLEKIN